MKEVCPICKEKKDVCSFQGHFGPYSYDCCASCYAKGYENYETLTSGANFGKLVISRYPDKMPAKQVELIRNNLNLYGKTDEDYIQDCRINVAAEKIHNVGELNKSNILEVTIENNRLYLPEEQQHKNINQLYVVKESDETIVDFYFSNPNDMVSEYNVIGVCKVIDNYVIIPEELKLDGKYYLDLMENIMCLQKSSLEIAANRFKQYAADIFESWKNTDFVPASENKTLNRARFLLKTNIILTDNNDGDYFEVKLITDGKAPDEYINLPNRQSFQEVHNLISSTKTRDDLYNELGDDCDYSWEIVKRTDNGIVATFVMSRNSKMISWDIYDKDINQELNYLTECLKNNVDAEASKVNRLKGNNIEFGDIIQDNKGNISVCVKNNRDDTVDAILCNGKINLDIEKFSTDDVIKINASGFKHIDDIAMLLKEEPFYYFFIWRTQWYLFKNRGNSQRAERDITSMIWGNIKSHYEGKLWFR